MAGIELGQLAVIASLVAANFALLKRVFDLGRVVEKVMGMVAALQTDLKKLEAEIDQMQRQKMIEMEEELHELRAEKKARISPRVAPRRVS